ncbi:MAG: 3-oxoadipate enol-lactonase [Rhodocyclaceae bacterium]|jgi:3-oxoadipate enol-lactonase|nr:3-oxoadipate enol-lactonase [Rhodocyclaceae bacterium]MBK6554171.1 3-oxoadipate enol-lactonase [Rhodocyclaceae bacterium]MBK9310546.1 3-oxoadipate enol-lactonase [Rhodocyclaceae bacterium]MBK9954383.1 3-oxoadipate enol-lactonase [Rhodocyclaceae bacterium]
MTTIRANGIDIRHDVQGSGPWLILSHSLATDLSMWDDQMAALTPHFRVLRFDTRGHGGTSAPDGAYDFAWLTADVLWLMERLGIGRAHFCGISLGGMIAQHVALAAPEKIDRLVLVSTTSAYGPEARALWAERIAAVRTGGMAPLVAPTLERWFTAPYRAARPEVMARVGAMIAATPAAGYIGCGQAIPLMDTTARLAQLRCPALVIAGADDAGMPPAMGRRIADHLPGARLKVIESAAHLCNIEQKDSFNSSLLEFLLA